MLWSCIIVFVSFYVLFSSVVTRLRRRALPAMDGKEGRVSGMGSQSVIADTLGK